MQVSSPTHISKFQHGGKEPFFEHQNINKICLIIIKVGYVLLYAKIVAGLMLRVGSNFLLNTSPKPHLQKVLSWRHPCHPWNLGLETPCEVVSTNFHALNNWDCMDQPQVTWDLDLGPRVNRPSVEFYNNASLQMVAYTNLFIYHSYKWSDWVWETTDWLSRLQENY